MLDHLLATLVTYHNNGLVQLQTQFTVLYTDGLLISDVISFVQRLVLFISN